MAHRHALPEPLGLSAQSQVPHGTRRSEGGGAGFTARKRHFPPAQPWVPGLSIPRMGWWSLCPSLAARTPTLQPKSRRFSRSRGARATPRAQPPPEATPTARGGRGRARAALVRTLWFGAFSHVFLARIFKIEREQKRGKRARARRLTFRDPARGVGGSTRTDRAGRARRRSSPVGREKRWRVLGQEPREGGGAASERRDPDPGERAARAHPPPWWVLGAGPR